MIFSNGPFTVEVVETISEKKGSWDEFHRQAPWLHSVQLQALEIAGPPDMSFRYVMISNGKDLVACAYLQLVTFSSANFSNDGPPVVSQLLKLLFRIKKIRLLFCGNIFRVDFPCLHFREEFISFSEALSIIESIGAREKCMLVMMKEMNVQLEKQRVLENKGFRKYEEDLTMALSLPEEWKSFEDYNRSLTKKYRKRLRKIRDVKSGLRVHPLKPEEVRSLLPRIGELFNQTASRQFLKMGLIDEKYFSAMQDAFGEDFFINGYFLGERLIGFASHIIHENMLEVHYIGIDYAYNESHALYFNMLYDGIETAIDMRKNLLELGRTAREAKASAGCKPVPSYDYLYVRNRFIRFLVGVFESLFLDKMGDDWKKRSPFKAVIQENVQTASVS